MNGEEFNEIHEFFGARAAEIGALWWLTRPCPNLRARP